MKPKIFVGCATQSLAIARAIQRELDDEVHQVKIWNQNALRAGPNLIDQLIDLPNEYDFGIFVFSADQVTENRGSVFSEAAANTIFEAGLFAGVLGKERTFIVSEEDEQLKLPSDLDGILRPTFVRPKNPDDLQANVASACNDIALAIRDQRSNPNINLFAAKKAEVERALQFVCNAIANPGLPEEFGIRAFVFELQNGELKNKFQWARFDILEREGTITFCPDHPEHANVAVVRALNSTTPIYELVEHSVQTDLAQQVPVEPQIRFVVASYIRDSKDRVRGVVNLDCTKEEGIALLQNEVAGTVMRVFGEILLRIDAV